MKRTLLAFSLIVTICGLLGCASPKANAEDSASTEPDSKPVAVQAQSRSAVKAESKKPVAAKQDASKKQNFASTSSDAADQKVETKIVDTKVGSAIERNPYLSSIVKPLLPPRTKLMDAAGGFKNQRQFIAALHVSKNLGIPFDEIKTRMTAQHRMSLNDSLRDIRSDMTKNLAKAEARKGEEQAKDDEKHAKNDEKQAKDESKKAAALTN